MPTTTASTLLAVALLAATTAGSSADGEGELDPPPTGPSWQLAAFGDPAAQVAEGHEATLELDAETSTASGFAGCNRYSTSYEMSGAELSFGLVRTTMMACPDEPRTLQEAAFLATLEKVAAFETSEDELRLLDSEGAEVLTFVSRPEAPSGESPGSSRFR